MREAACASLSQRAWALIDESDLMNADSFEAAMILMDGIGLAYSEVFHR